MPVITRSQSKMSHKSRDNIQKRVENEKFVKNIQERVENEKFVKEMKSLSDSLSFTNQVKELLEDVAKTTGVSEKIVKTTMIYKMVNRQLPALIEDNKRKWFNFTITMFNKTYELEHGQYSLVDKDVLATFTEELIKSRKILYDHYTKFPQNIVWF